MKVADAGMTVDIIMMHIKSIYLLGFISDGEFNYLRMRGYTQPLTVLQIRADVRKKYSNLPHKKLVANVDPKKYESAIVEYCIYETLLELADCNIVAELSNPAIKEDLLKEIWLMKVNGILWEDIIQRLRTRTVPAGYAYCSLWQKGKKFN